MPASVRLGDKSAGHCFNPRPNVQGSSNVFINGIAAHRVSDYWPKHRCGPRSHDSITAQGSPNVFINGLAAARIGDELSCGDHCAEGSPNVFVN